VAADIGVIERQTTAKDCGTRLIYSWRKPNESERESSEEGE